MRIPKIIVEAYGQTFKFDSRITCGYIKCDRLKKVYQITKKAEPLETKKGNSFLCPGCGQFTHESIFYHTILYKGKNITYGYELLWYLKK